MDEECIKQVKEMAKREELRKTGIFGGSRKPIFPEVVAVCCKVQDYPWKNSEANLVFGMWALCYQSLTEILRLLTSIFRALRRGGRVVFVEPVKGMQDKDRQERW